MNTSRIFILKWNDVSCLSRHCILDIGDGDRKSIYSRKQVRKKIERMSFDTSTLLRKEKVLLSVKKEERQRNTTSQMRINVAR